MAQYDDEELLTAGLGGTRIGPFKLLEQVGEGGMGIVYLAEQLEPVNRQVALKLMRPGRQSLAVLERFRRERDTLAMLSHPNLATILDAGTTEDGTPYFVMEYVPGQDLISYADDNGLTNRERLVLLMQVCNGMLHAHQKGIIHRDIKPSNLLAYGAEGRHMVKVIDFGLAKDLDGGSQHTTDGELVGTPFYMSPEQAEGKPVDVRTDVYAMGLVLYELLVGELPFDRTSGSTYSYLMKMLKVEPPRPSKRLGSLGDSASDQAASRGSTLQGLERQLKGELDWIVVKALCREPEERYPTVADLAADIRRFLNDEPVLAGPGTRRYRFKKFVSRHRTAVVSTALVVVAMITATVVSTISLIRVSASEQRYREVAAQSQVINAFLEDLLTSPDPRHEGRDLRVAELIADQSLMLDEALGSQPLLAARVRRTLGKTFTALGDYEQAQTLLETALKQQVDLIGPTHLDTLETQLQLALVRLRQGRFSEAEDLAKDVCNQRDKQLGGDHPLTMYALTLRAHAMYRADNVELAERILTENAARQNRVLGPEHADTLYSLHIRANALRRLDRLEEAEALYRDVLARREKTLGLDHPDTIESRNNLANAQFTAGNYEEAEANYRAAYEARLSVLGPDHSQTLMSANNIGAICYAQRRYEEAGEWYRQTLATQERTLDPRHVDIAMSQNNLANVYRRSGRHRESARLYRAALSILDEQVGSGHTEAIRTRLNLVKLYMQMESWPQALQLAEETIGYAPEVPDGYHFKAQILSALGDTKGLIAFLESRVVEDVSALEFRAQLVQVYAQQGSFEKAEMHAHSLIETADKSLVEQLRSDLLQANSPFANRFEALIGEPAATIE